MTHPRIIQFHSNMVQSLVTSQHIHYIQGQRLEGQGHSVM